MSNADAIGAIIGGAMVVLVLWKIRSHGAVRPTNDVDPDSRSNDGSGDYGSGD